MARARWMVVVASLSWACAAEDDDPDGGAGNAAVGNNDDAGRTDAADGRGNEAGTGGSSHGGRGGQTAGGQGGAGGVQELRHDECVVADDGQSCSPTRDVEGSVCCSMVAVEYDSVRRCTIGEQPRAIGCWADREPDGCGSELAVSCMMDEDGAIFFSSSTYLHAGTAGLTSCPMDLEQEVTSAPNCSGP